MYWSIITFSTVVSRLLHAMNVCATLSQYARLELEQVTRMHVVRPSRGVACCHLVCRPSSAACCVPF
jgi:hypothetical protein